jgi:hypothetical protein
MRQVRSGQGCAPNKEDVIGKLIADEGKQVGDHMVAAYLLVRDAELLGDGLQLPDVKRHRDDAAGSSSSTGLTCCARRKARPSRWRAASALSTA